MKTREKVLRMHFLFEKIMKILKTDGIYLCISLLQEHILTSVLTFFKEKKYKVDLYEVSIGAENLCQ
jgi:hypothetical protein